MLKYLQFLNEAKKDFQFRLYMTDDIKRLLMSGELKNNNISKRLIDCIIHNDKNNFINTTDEKDTISYLNLDKLPMVLPKLTPPKVGDIVIVTVKEKKNLKDDAYEHLMSKTKFTIKDTTLYKENYFIDIGHIYKDGLPTWYSMNRFKLQGDITEHIDQKMLDNLNKSDLDIIYGSKLRQEIKIGKFVNKIFGNEFTDAEYEKFVNVYKSELSDIFRNFELVDGEDIPKWYNCENYIRGGGNLNGSCMRSSPKTYFNIYAKNKKNIKMLILKDPMSDKITGRSLVWYLDEPEGSVFMDTIYTTEDYMKELYLSYARNNGWIYKTRQSYSDYSYTVDGKEKHINMSLKIKDVKYVKYPFMDTMKYYSTETNMLYNYEPVDVKKLYRLRSQGGDYELIRN